MAEEMSIDTYGRLKPKAGIPRLNLVLFLVTLATTFGAGYLQSSSLVELGLVETPWPGAIAFSVGLMAILGCHEMGHKLMSQKRGVDATFPYFIPAPTFVGTFGAMIRMKTRPGDRKALFDIGAAGPIAGFLALVPVTVLGILWSFPVTIALVNATPLSEPLLFKLLEDWLLDLPAGTDLLLHPLAFSGWVGMIITALNLVPVGSLDGGHVSRAMFGDRTLFVFSSIRVSLQRAISLLAVIAVALSGYWLMALLMLYFGAMGHPGPARDDVPVNTRRRIIGVALLGLLIVCAAPLSIG